VQAGSHLATTSCSGWRMPSAASQAEPTWTLAVPELVHASTDRKWHETGQVGNELLATASTSRSKPTAGLKQQL
jgi:hypothetical protein